jgi:hypothetical protein
MVKWLVKVFVPATTVKKPEPPGVSGATRVWAERGGRRQGAANSRHVSGSPSATYAVPGIVRRPRAIPVPRALRPWRGYPGGNRHGGCESVPRRVGSRACRRPVDRSGTRSNRPDGRSITAAFFSHVIRPFWLARLANERRFLPEFAEINTF